MSNWFINLAKHFPELEFFFHLIFTLPLQDYFQEDDIEEILPHVRFLFLIDEVYSGTQVNEL